jgi:hypothetical protein
MARRRKPNESRNLAVHGESVLDRLKAGEAQIVLNRLLAVHPQLRAEAGQIAQSFLSEVAFDLVAQEVEEEAALLDLADLENRAGAHSWGYEHPADAAWELLEERVSSFIEDMQRQLELGLDAEALETCKGIVLGLYRLRDRKDNDVIPWAEDFAAETACGVIATWRAGDNRHPRKGGRQQRRMFPQAFVTEFVPEWEELISRA